METLKQTITVSKKIRRSKKALPPSLSALNGVEPDGTPRHAVEAASVVTDGKPERIVRRAGPPLLKGFSPILQDAARLYCAEVEFIAAGGAGRDPLAGPGAAGAGVSEGRQAMLVDRAERLRLLHRRLEWGIRLFRAEGDAGVISGRRLLEMVALEGLSIREVFSRFGVVRTVGRARKVGEALRRALTETARIFGLLA